MPQHLKNILIDRFSTQIAVNTLEWKEVLLQSTNSSSLYFQSTTQYFQAYFKGLSTTPTYNLSLVLLQNQKPVAIAPLFIYKNNNWIISSNGSSIVAPLFINNLTKKSISKIEKTYIEIIKFIALYLKIDKWDSTFTIKEQGLTSWGSRLLNNSNKIKTSFSLFVNLKNDIQSIESNFRKSYKPLISQGLKQWKTEVLTKVDDSTFSDFQKLHLLVSGKKTRNQETWDIQKSQINNNEAFLVYVKDPNNDELVGAALFTYTKDEGQYSIGAYRRDINSPSLSHIVQIQAIKFLKQLNCNYYNLGERFYHNNNYQPTEKEFSIAFFKEGFATNSFVQLTTTTKILKT